MVSQGQMTPVGAGSGGGGSIGGSGGGQGLVGLGGMSNDGISSDCSDDESSPQSGGQMPVVYPWMKKIHVGTSGKFKKFKKL